MNKDIDIRAILQGESLKKILERSKFTKSRSQ